MYGGQGKILIKNNLTTTIITTRNNNEHAATASTLSTEHGGLDQPLLDYTNREVTGDNRCQLCKQNKKKKQQLRALQHRGSQWTDHTGTVPCDTTPLPRLREPYRNSMCPTGRALHHPAAKILHEWATLGCPTSMGRDWTKSEMWEAVEWGPHRSAMSPEALEHFAVEIREKLHKNQARLVPWDDVKEDPSRQLKISPIAAIPHKSKAFQSILDLSFRLRLKNGGVLVAMNDTTVKRAPKGAIDQLGECLTRIIHAFAEAGDDAKIFMAKWDIKDGYWRMDCREGEEWNFSYVLPKPEGKPVMLVVPTSLQMGWVESPRIFAQHWKQHVTLQRSTPTCRWGHYHLTNLRNTSVAGNCMQSCGRTTTTNLFGRCWRCMLMTS